MNHPKPWVKWTCLEPALRLPLQKDQSVRRHRRGESHPAINTLLPPGLHAIPRFWLSFHSSIHQPATGMLPQGATSRNRERSVQRVLMAVLSALPVNSAVCDLLYPTDSPRKFPFWLSVQSKQLS
jgi:hypothetical protein